LVTDAPQQGEIWWATADKRRPVLIVTRSPAVPVLRSIVVAPITRSVRHLPTEIALDRRNGLRDECCASFDNLQPMPRELLTKRVGTLGPEQLGDICRALEALADC
jgi:mRNA interferase MazF